MEAVKLRRRKPYLMRMETPRSTVDARRLVGDRVAKGERETDRAVVGQRELGFPLQACRSLLVFRNPGRDDYDWK